MNAKLLAGLTAAVTSTIAFSAISAPAQAFQFGNSGIQFDSDTTVNFSFVGSHGAYTSALKVFEASNLSQSVGSLFWETRQSDNEWQNEWQGTFGNAVTSASGQNSAAFTFRAGVSYVLGLVSGSDGTVYSTNASNSGGTQQAVFGAASVLGPSLNTSTTATFGGAASFSSGNPFAGPVMISFDDRGNVNDRDFQDFTVNAQAVPEPLTMGGIALAGAGLAYARRRRSMA